MIHELRIYTIQPGRLAEFVDLAGSVSRPIRGDRFGRLVGYWTTEHGPLNQALHLWEFADIAARAQARAGLAKDERWQKEYVPRSQPFLVSQENMLLTPFDWCPIRSASGMGVYELRIYRLHPGKIAEWARGVQAALPIREKHSSPIGFWQVEVGSLNTVVHIWPYRDWQHRAEVWKALASDAAWQDARKQFHPLMQVQESRLLVPASFSPLR